MPLVARHVAHGAHVVGSVRQLDEDDPHIARHRQEHFAERLCLIFFAVVELQFFEFGETVDQIGNTDAELFGHLDFGDAAVFEDVVHQGRHQSLRVELPVSA